MTLHVITLKQRFVDVAQEMRSHKINARFWSGFTDSNPKSNISRSHKKIVAYAKQEGLDKVIIAEDDIKFTHPKSFDYFLSQIPKDNDYDILLASYYAGVQTGNEVKGFRGLTLYAVNARFYDKFLSAMDNLNIDNALNMLGGKIIVCDKFCAVQKPGYSFQKQENVNYDYLLKGKPIYEGE